MENQINDRDCLFTHLLNDKDTVIQHGQLWPCCGLIKYVQLSNCIVGVEFSETNSIAALPERQAELLKGKMKGLKRHGVTLCFLVRVPQNMTNACEPFSERPCLPHGVKAFTFRTHFTSNDALLEEKRKKPETAESLT